MKELRCPVKDIIDQISGIQAQVESQSTEYKSYKLLENVLIIIQFWTKFTCCLQNSRKQPAEGQHNKTQSKVLREHFFSLNTLLCLSKLNDTCVKVLDIMTRFNLLCVS